jgi:hypothetical protein
MTFLAAPPNGQGGSTTTFQLIEINESADAHCKIHDFGHNRGKLRFIVSRRHCRRRKKSHAESLNVLDLKIPRGFPESAILDDLLEYCERRKEHVG